LTVRKLVDLGAGINAIGGNGRSRVIARAGRLLDLLNAFDADRSAAEVYQDALDPGRWIDYAGDNADLARDDLGRLLSECARVVGDQPTLRDLVKTLRYRIATREPLGEPLDRGVRIVTLWGAKGLTADHVYVIGLCDEALPGPNDPDTSGLEPAEHLAEQRRLLFVSLTRARQTLVLSRVNRLSRGKVASLGLMRTNRGNRYNQDLRPCRFFDDVPGTAIPTSVPGRTWGGINL
jgi:superfamily I DNA/RNA helicase